MASREFADATTKLPKQPHPPLLIRVGVRVQKSHRESIKAALASSKTIMPLKLNDAIGKSSSLELCPLGEFVIKLKRNSPRPSNVAMKLIRQILSGSSRAGWSEWLQGERGWASMVKDKCHYLNFHRALHEAYDDVMRSLLKAHTTRMRQHLSTIYYKDEEGPTIYSDLCRFQNVGQRTKRRLWTKVPASGSLQDAVGRVRPFLEVLYHICHDDTSKDRGWHDIPWNMPLQVGAFKSRESKIKQIKEWVTILLRNSDGGPDVPVLWAMHPPQNSNPLCVVTDQTMVELIVGVANILADLFLPSKPFPITRLDDVEKIIKVLKDRYCSPLAASSPSGIGKKHETTSWKHLNNFCFSQIKQSKALSYSELLISKIDNPNNNRDKITNKRTNNKHFGRKRKHHDNNGGNGFSTLEEANHVGGRQQHPLVVGRRVTSKRRSPSTETPLSLTEDQLGIDWKKRCEMVPSSPPVEHLVYHQHQHQHQQLVKSGERLNKVYHQEGNRIDVVGNNVFGLCNPQQQHQQQDHYHQSLLIVGEEEEEQHVVLQTKTRTSKVTSRKRKKKRRATGKHK